MMVIKCNVLGMWRNYDFEIEKVCNSEYSNSYQMYKNVFCVICNLFVFLEDIQQKLCVLILENDMIVVCYDYLFIMFIYLFKNVFCKYCMQVVILYYGIFFYFLFWYLYN